MRYHTKLRAFEINLFLFQKTYSRHSRQNESKLLTKIIMSYIIHMTEGFMKRTTIFADDNLIKEIKEISKEENRSAAEIIREAMLTYIKHKRHRKKKLSFIGIGSSGRRDIAERHEELLWKKVIK